MREKGNSRAIRPDPCRFNGSSGRAGAAVPARDGGVQRFRCRLPAGEGQRSCGPSAPDIASHQVISVAARSNCCDSNSEAAITTALNNAFGISHSKSRRTVSRRQLSENTIQFKPVWNRPSGFGHRRPAENPQLEATSCDLAMAKGHAIG
jgi:hypothetical protein